MYRIKFILFFTLLLHNKFSKSTKWLIENPGFNDPAAWLDEYLPCAKENVIFPRDYQSLLPLPSNVDVGGFILPQNGAILFEKDSTITLKGDSHARECENGEASLKIPQIKKWFDPKTWRSSKAEQENKAIPDMERVPCNNESVILQSKGPLHLDLEQVPYLRLGQLSFAGSLLSKTYVRELLNTDVGEYLFSNQDAVNVEYYHIDVCGCHKDFNDFTEPICHNVIESCERPHCLAPVIPYGSCCAICGVVLKFQVDSCGNQRIHTLSNIIEKGLEKQDLKADIDYHVNYLSSREYGIYLQAIIVDKSDYNEQSVKFIRRLNDSTNWSSTLKLQANFATGFDFSGRPYNPNVTFGSILLIMFCLVFVSIVSVVIFAYYHPDSDYLHYIPRWVYDPRLWRLYALRPNVMFARLDNLRASTRTVTTAFEGVGNPGFTIGYDAESGEVRERSFNNPMYGDMPKTSKATMSGLAEGSKTKENEEAKDHVELLNTTDDMHKLTLESGKLVDTNVGEDEEELSEIKLEPISTSSEDEDDNDDGDGDGAAAMKEFKKIK